MTTTAYICVLPPSYAGLRKHAPCRDAPARAQGQYGQVAAVAAVAACQTAIWHGCDRKRAMQLTCRSWSPAPQQAQRRASWGLSSSRRWSASFHLPAPARWACTGTSTRSAARASRRVPAPPVPLPVTIGPGHTSGLNERTSCGTRAFRTSHLGMCVPWDAAPLQRPLGIMLES